jgi:hypothetical protein
MLAVATGYGLVLAPSRGYIFDTVLTFGLRKKGL